MPLVTTGYRFGQGGYYKDDDGSGPYAISSAGVATLIGGASAGGGAATIADGADVATGSRADAAAASPAATASVIAILKGLWTTLLGVLNVNTLAALGVARQLTAGAASSNTALTTTTRRISLVARGGDVRIAIGTGGQTASATTSHFLQSGERVDLGVPANAQIAVIRVGSVDAPVELSELT